MVLPLAPFLIGGVGVVTGLVLGGDNSEAQVVVNTSPQAVTSTSTTLLRGALLGGAALAAFTLGPKILGKK